MKEDARLPLNQRKTRRNSPKHFLSPLRVLQFLRRARSTTPSAHPTLFHGKSDARERDGISQRQILGKEEWMRLTKEDCDGGMERVWETVCITVKAKHLKLLGCRTDWKWVREIRRNRTNSREILTFLFIYSHFILGSEKSKAGQLPTFRWISFSFSVAISVFISDLKTLNTRTFSFSSFFTLSYSRFFSACC